MRTTSLTVRCTLVLITMLTSGCLYRMAVQQGNVLDPADVAKLEDGMTRSQVMYLLGTPMLPNGFDTDRWDYFYSVRVGRMQQEYTRRLTIYFKDDKVERFEGDAVTGPALKGEATAASAGAAPG